MKQSLFYCVLRLGIKENNYLAVIFRADRICGNTLDVLNLRVDYSSLVGVHRFKHNALLVFEHL